MTKAKDEDLGDNTGGASETDLAAELLAAEEAEKAKEAEAAEKAAKAEKAKEAAAEKAAKARAKPKTVKTPDRVKIILEDNDDIPPTGLFVGLNGKGYLIPTGQEVEVPLGVVDILEHAITSTPKVDPQTRQVIGYRDRMRYPFRRIVDKE